LSFKDLVDDGYRVRFYSPALISAGCPSAVDICPLIYIRTIIKKLFYWK